MNLKDLKPSDLWRFFEEICGIPRLSKNEDGIRRYLLDFAAKHKLESETDKIGNVIIRKPASEGYDNRRSVVLQSHMDMVGEKDISSDHDWKTDPIIPVIEDGWVRANKTTLGADDGIGIAAQLAILADKNLKMGPIECLFTVDEETGMTGAINIDKNLVKSEILLNLDSEDEGELFIGCAGGMDTVALFNCNFDKPPKDSQFARIEVSGLKGGHSGDEIHKNLGNAVKLINELLIDIESLYGIGIAEFEAGNLRNAIAREASALICCNKDDIKRIGDYITEFTDKVKKRLGDDDPYLMISLSIEKKHANVLAKRQQENINKSLKECPHGVINWSKSMKNLVETSTNLASAKLRNDGILEVVTSQRSSVTEDKKKVSDRIKHLFESAGAKVNQSNGYPGWKPDLDSGILHITTNAYRKLFGIEPVVRAIHAGLECGLFLEKYPGLDMVSFGPTIKGAHTPEERINIESSERFWDLLLEVIDKIPERA